LAAVLRDRPLLVACLATLGVVLPALAFFAPQYDTNDDTSMNLIAAGRAFADRPDEHLVFTNVVIGLVLKWLYGVAPLTPWYGLYQLVTLSAASVATIDVLLRVSPGVRQAGLAWLYLVAVFLPSLLIVQFTKTAFLASLAGLMLLLAPAGGAPHRSRLAELAGAALVVLGSLIRFESLLMACLMALPVVVAGALRLRREAWRPAVPLAASLVVAVALYGLNAAYYARDPEWKDFYAYNALRVQFTDYHRYHSEAAGPTFEAAGWKPVDLNMLESWFFADPDKYSLATLRKIVAEAPRVPPASPWRVAAVMVSQIGNNYLLLRLALAGCAAIVLTWGRPWPFLPLALFALAFAAGVALSTWFWITTRVAFSLLAGVLALMGLRPERNDSPGAARRDGLAGKILLAGVAILAVGLTGWALNDMARIDARHRDNHRKTARLVAQLEPRPDQLFVCWSDQFPFEHLVAPLADLGTLRDFRCVSLSWILPTPITSRRMHEYRLPDVYRAIWERPDVYLVASRDLVVMYQFYVEQNYNVRVRCRPTFDHEPIQVYQGVVPGKPR
jgi:hypothetical protein